MVKTVELSYLFKSAVGTGIDAFITEVTFLPIDYALIVFLMNGFEGADFHAFEAGHTISIDGHQFRVGPDAFRVATPFAGERTPF
jgi:hypothetical protein